MVGIAALGVCIVFLGGGLVMLGSLRTNNHLTLPAGFVIAFIGAGLIAEVLYRLGAYS